MFIKLENDRGVTTTFEITQYTTEYGDPDEIDSPRDSYFLTVWRNDGMSEDFVLMGRKNFIKNFTKIGSLTDGPWCAFYIMNNNGKTIDRFRIPELWRTDLDRMQNNETMPDILDRTRKGEDINKSPDEDEVRVGVPHSSFVKMNELDRVRVGIPRRAGASIIGQGNVDESDPDCEAGCKQHKTCE